nr:hypothetical protein CFP56_07111 [Quercus suber]
MINVGFGRFGIVGIGGIVGFGNVGFGRVGILGIGGIVGFGNGAPIRPSSVFLRSDSVFLSSDSAILTQDLLSSFTQISSNPAVLG